MSEPKDDQQTSPELSPEDLGEISGGAFVDGSVRITDGTSNTLQIGEVKIK